MLQYFLRRALVAIPAILGVIVIVFAMVRLAPGDPAILLAGEFADEATVERIRVRFGLDRPVPEQFVLFLGNMAQGDLGRSTRTNRLVIDDLRQRFPNTLELAFSAIIVAFLIGVPAGVISALKRNTWADALVTFLALLGVSMPVFWFGLLAILYFSVNLGWFPVAGRGTLAHLVLPAITLGVSSTAIISRMTRSAMLEVMDQDFIRTARAKGLQGRLIVFKHGLRNALIPVVTIGGLEFGNLMAGAVLTETVFNWPGVGRLLVDSILARDYPVVQGAVLVIAMTFIVVNLLVDLVYGTIDPRIRYD
ncbi:MAG: nickel ABC transporter permease [Trueperaceae bacterium]